MRLFEIARRFDMHVQPQLILLQKTLLQIEGLGRQLYPELDLWKTAQPIMQEWGADRLSGRNIAQELRRQLPDLSESVRMLPQLLQQFVQKASEGTLRIRVDHGTVRGTAARDPRQRAPPRPDDRRRRGAAGRHPLAGVPQRLAARRGAERGRAADGDTGAALTPRFRSGRPGARRSTRHVQARACLPFQARPDMPGRTP